MNFNPTPPEPRFIFCDNCDSEIYEGGTVFVFNAQILCEDCFDEIVEFILGKEV